jgi:hypothetical protein
MKTMNAESWLDVASERESAGDHEGAAFALKTAVKHEIVERAYALDLKIEAREARERASGMYQHPRTWHKPNGGDPIGGYCQDCR